MTTNHAAVLDRQAGYARRLAQLGLCAFCAHWPLLALAGIYLVVDLAVVSSLAAPQHLQFLVLAKGFLTTTVPIAVLGLIFYRIGVVCFRDRPNSPLIAIAEDLRDYFGNVRRLVNAAPVVLALFAFMYAYTDIKINIPAINPFSWDETFAHWDKALHLGAHPFEWLQWGFDQPLISGLLASVYGLWFLVMLALWAWYAFSPTFDAERLQFLFAFVLTWMLGGSLLATVFSSAGPVFYGDLGLQPDPFAPLKAYVAAIDNGLGGHVAKLQRIVWTAYETRDPQVIAGISAMPSMHNATSLLFALAGWRIDRRAGVALAVFAVLVLIASVHLGWHYAIDAYAGYAVSLACWFAAGRLAQWCVTRPTARAYVKNLHGE